MHAGGHVTIESEKGVGTTFFVYLPATDEKPAVENIQPAISSHLPSAGEKILLVEDEEPVRRLVSRILESAGYEVLPAGSGSEALEMLQPETRVDLLLTDVLMPGMSGVELAADLKAQRPELRVLLMSGYAEDVVFPDTGAERIHPLLSKPFDKEALLAELRHCLAAPPRSLPDRDEDAGGV